MLDAADALLLSAGKGAGLVAEKFALDHLFGQSAAIQRNEIALRTAAPAVQQAGDHLLAAAGLAGHENIDIRISDLAQGLAQAVHHQRLSDQRKVFLCLPRRFLQAAVFHDEAALFRRPVHTLDEPLGRKGLGDEIIDAILNGFHRRRDIAMAGHENDGNFAIKIADTLEELQSVHAGHADIGHHNPGEIHVERR